MIRGVWGITWGPPLSIFPNQRARVGVRLGWYCFIIPKKNIYKSLSYKVETVFSKCDIMKVIVFKDIVFSRDSIEN